MLFCCCGATSPQHFPKKTALNFVCVCVCAASPMHSRNSSPAVRLKNINIYIRICFVVERTESTMFLLVADTVHSSV